MKFVGIPTTDQDRALEFYTEKLGFEISTDQVFDERQRWIELRIANSPTRVVLFTPEGHENRIGTFFNGTSTKYKCDFNRDSGWDILRRSGFDTVRQVAIDEDWSALRFRRVEFINHRAGK